MAGSREPAGNEQQAMDARATEAQASAGEMTPEVRTETRPRSRGRSRVRMYASEVVVHERVIREATGHGDTIIYATLTPTNYIEWALIMQINPRAQELWEAMLGEGMVTDHEDMTVVTALIRAVPPEMHCVLAVKNSAYGAWEAVHTMRMGVTRVREATTQRLRTNFEQIAFKDGETLDGFSTASPALSTTSDRLATMLRRYASCKISCAWCRRGTLRSLAPSRPALI